MIQGVAHAWELQRVGDADAPWFERLLTPQFRAAFAALDGCEQYAVFSAEHVPPVRRSRDWDLLINAVAAYPALELPQKSLLLRALAGLSLYRDFERLAAGDRLSREETWSEARCRHALLVARVRFLLREPRMGRRQVLAFLDIAERAPRGSSVRLEAAIFFLSRALEKGLPAPDVARADALARRELESLKTKLFPFEHARWESKYWRCVSYRPYLQGRPEQARRQLDAAESAARESLRLTPRNRPSFGREDLYGVLTTKVLTEAKLGFPGRSRAALAELVAMDPEGSWQRVESGRALMAAGELEGARAEFAEAVRLGPPRRAEAARLLAECASRLGRKGEAAHWGEEGRRLEAAERFHGGERRPAEKCGATNSARTPRASSGASGAGRAEAGGSRIYTRDSAAYAQFRPYLALEAAERPPALIAGVLETWRQLDTGAPGVWYERSLPTAFRRDFRWIPGLEPYAVSSADELAPEMRSPAWERLLDWKRRYATLEPARKVALLKLLGMLGFYQDNAELMRGDAPPSERAVWSERESEYAYLRANNRVLLDEPGLKGDYSEMFRVAARAAPGTGIRLLSAIKTMTLYAEHGLEHRNLHEAEAIARETLERLRERESPSAFLAMSSRYWRTASYFPFLRGDLDETDRRLDRAEDCVRRAIAAGSDAEAAFARDVLYAVLATRAATDMRTRRPRRAKPRLAEMIALDPFGAWQRLWLGMALFELDELEAARASFLDCLRLAPPGIHKACGWLSRCLQRLGRQDDAAKWKARAALTDPARPAAGGGEAQAKERR